MATDGSGPPPVAVRWNAVLLAGVAILTLSMARQGKNVIVPLWGDHLTLSVSAISLAVAVGAAVELVLLIPGGLLKNQLGRASVLVACLLMLGVEFALLPLGGTLGWFVIGIAVASIGNGLGAGINMTIGADLSPPVGRAKFLGYWNAISQSGSLGRTRSRHRRHRHLEPRERGHRPRRRAAGRCGLAAGHRPADRTTGSRVHAPQTRRSVGTHHCRRRSDQPLRSTAPRMGWTGSSGSA